VQHARVIYTERERASTSNAIELEQTSELAHRLRMKFRKTLPAHQRTLKTHSGATSPRLAVIA